MKKKYYDLEYRVQVVFLPFSFLSVIKVGSSGSFPWRRCPARVQATEAPDQSLYNLALLALQGDVGLGRLTARHLHRSHYGNAKLPRGCYYHRILAFYCRLLPGTGSRGDAVARNEPQLHPRLEQPNRYH